MRQSFNPWTHASPTAPKAMGTSNSINTQAAPIFSVILPWYLDWSWTSHKHFKRKLIQTARVSPSLTTPELLGAASHHNGCFCGIPCESPLRRTPSFPTLGRWRTVSLSVTGYSILLQHVTAMILAICSRVLQIWWINVHASCSQYIISIFMVLRTPCLTLII